jgi:radical SAM superfamily enzyme YgiQ (UPF0313 family)
MNALLVYPEFPDTFWSFKHAIKFIGRKAALPPLGLLTVAAMLPEEWSLRLVDMNIEKLTEDELAWADCVLISAMIAQRSSARGLIARCTMAGVPVIAGGPLFTEESEQFPDVDHLVLGEAEEILPQFLADFKAGSAGHIYRASGFPDVRMTPIPRWDLLTMRAYVSMAVQFSRGCPYDCEFCDVAVLFGRRPRLKTPEHMITELDALWQAGWRKGIFFVDDNFIGNKPYLKETLLPALIEWRARGRTNYFYTEATLNLADDEELTKQMVAAGFNWVFVGIETPAKEGLVECNKLQNTRRDMLQSVRILQNAGLEVQAGFIVGFDSDTPSIFKRQFEFIQRSGVVTAMVGILQAFPGTRLYKRLQAEGRIRDVATGDNVDGTTNIVPRMSLEVLRAGHRWLVSRIYEPKYYYRRVRTLLREYNPPRVKNQFDLQHFFALWRSFFYIGFLGRERLHYWGLIIWMLFRRPRLFSTGVKHAIYGYHFRKVCNK